MFRCVRQIQCSGSTRAEPSRPNSSPESVNPLTCSRPSDDRLREAKQAMLQQEFDRVVALIGNLLDEVAACVLHVQALASADSGRALQVCPDLLRKHSLSAELHCLHALLLMGEGRSDAASTAIRRGLFLNRSLIMGHFLHGILLQQTGDIVGAVRCFRNAGNLTCKLPGDQSVPLSDNESAADLVRACDRHLQKLLSG